MAATNEGGFSWGGVLNSVVSLGTRYGEKALFGDDEKEAAERTADVELKKSELSMKTLIAVAAIIVAGIGLIILVPRVLRAS